MSTALSLDHNASWQRPVSARHLMLIANGNASGVGGSREVFDGAVRQLRDRGARVEAHVTTTLDELAHLVHEAHRRVVLLGGDGSVHAFANVDGPKPEVALLPAGRANNIAHSLSIPIDLAAAARVAVESGTRPLDLIAATANGRPCTRSRASASASTRSRAPATAASTRPTSARASRPPRRPSRASSPAPSSSRATARPSSRA